MWVFFFFKQKTAYEITRRDWSSDVCSSDLRSMHRRIGAMQSRATWNSFRVLSHGRSEERRVGKECALLCRSRWSPAHLKKKKINNTSYPKKTKMKMLKSSFLRR